MRCASAISSVHKIFGVARVGRGGDAPRTHEYMTICVSVCRLCCNVDKKENDRNTAHTAREAHVFASLLFRMCLCVCDMGGNGDRGKGGSSKYFYIDCSSMYKLQTKYQESDNFGEMCIYSTSTSTYIWKKRGPSHIYGECFSFFAHYTRARLSLPKPHHPSDDDDDDGGVAGQPPQTFRGRARGTSFRSGSYFMAAEREWPYRCAPDDMH